MRITAKFLLVLIVTTASVLGISAWLRVRREVELFEDDMRRDESLVSDALAHAVERTWLFEGEMAARDLLRAISRNRHVTSRIRWLDEVTKQQRAGGAIAPTGAAAAASVISRSHPLIVRDDRRGVLDTFRELNVPGSRRAVLQLSESLADERQYVQTSIGDSLTSTGILLLASGGASIILGLVFIARPTRRLVDKARRIGAGDLSGPLGLRQRDELGELGRAIDQMCAELDKARANLVVESTARLAAVEQLRHADRLTTVGKLASGLAHELGTPLNVVAGRAQMIASGELVDGEATESARIIYEQTNRMTAIIRQLLDFARRGKPGESSRSDLRACAARITGILGAIARKAGIDLAIAPGDPVRATIDEGQVQQVLSNLIVNAIQATRPGGHVTVEVGRVDAVPPVDIGGGRRPMSAISVRDDGCGMSTDVANRVFEPFFTTKQVGEGTGLGLSVAHGIVRDHGGWIALESSEGKGSVFTIYLPPAEAS